MAQRRRHQQQRLQACLACLLLAHAWLAAADSPSQAAAAQRTLLAVPATQQHELRASSAAAGRVQAAVRQGPAAAAGAAGGAAAAAAAARAATQPRRLGPLSSSSRTGAAVARQPHERGQQQQQQQQAQVQARQQQLPPASGGELPATGRPRGVQAAPGGDEAADDLGTRGAAENSLTTAVAAATDTEQGDVQRTATAAAAATGDTADSGGEAPWQPRVLAGPVPKWPRLYGVMPVPSPTLLTRDSRAAAKAALLEATKRATTPQGVSARSIPGLGLEDMVLIARLLGHDVSGDFDAPGRLGPANPEYWPLLDRQLEGHSAVKHMFESTYYKCGKLNADLLLRSRSAAQMEAEALGHILAWLGLEERQLPEAAGFDELLGVLASVGAHVRLVTDPVPFLLTSTPPLDRNGIPMLIHMTFKDKGAFARHHLLSLASWARENPDHVVLMYDDADLDAYVSTYAPAELGLYRGLQTAVERSDFWRYLVMCHSGGVYTDADTLCVRPIQEWNREAANDAEVLLGVEDVFTRDPGAPPSGWGVGSGRFGVQFQQWTLCGAPGHAVFCAMPARIRQRMAEQQQQRRGGSADEQNWSILHRTGPHVWTDSVLSWMHAQGVGFHEALVPGGRLVANATRLMPGETFGCAAHFFSPAARLEEVYAMHMFRGVWRKRLDAGAEESQAAHASSGLAVQEQR